MEGYAKIVNFYWLLTTFAKGSILNLFLFISNLFIVHNFK